MSIFIYFKFVTIRQPMYGNYFFVKRMGEVVLVKGSQIHWDFLLMLPNLKKKFNVLLRLLQISWLVRSSAFLFHAGCLFTSQCTNDFHCYRQIGISVLQEQGGAENAGVENAGVENAGVDSRGGKCRSPLLHFPPLLSTPAFSTPAFSTLAILTVSHFPLPRFQSPPKMVQLRMQ